ncbi:hypothetical protein [Paenibacillus apiarius]|uniref:Tail fiber protein n=1 Tax=Paenibacillus apiarius TaxID=46240 RepID=A0ABT4DY06_9BACL|nr:hypothetical protein [Paenibacillus apiarius]MCY9516377.1 hypothetical protein [Paenibacillus apiarius]MCY9521163.1 hypothetical protein [Paenibacillus apiarius]MCY9552010.1 hypothetical protein [Paenibacillus apiarius]MCY9560955.1 hypothetical protein [Paenibacillus apiarius]MCY9684584.1 hypothetical protein [Paenibacillus apiarius]
MAFQKPLPEWKKQGMRPPESKITEGYNVMDKPPAAWMNWHMNTTYEALEELQNNAAEKTDVTSALSEAKSYADQKVADIDLSKITPEYIGAETPAGAQAKADEAAAKSVPKNGNADKNGTFQIFSDADTLNLFGTTHTYMTFQPNGHAGGRTGYIGASNPANPKNMIIASDKGNIDLYGTHITHNGRNVLGEIDSLKTSGVDAKNKIAGAINAKGVPASANDTFDQLAGKIGQINTGKKFAQGGHGNTKLSMEIRGLSFTPAYILINWYTSEQYGYYVHYGFLWARSINPVGGAMYGSSVSFDRYGSSTGNMSSNNLPGQIYSDGFRVQLGYNSDHERTSISWIAFEE